MVGIPRQGTFGFPVKLPRSSFTQNHWYPVDGYSDLPDVQMQPGGIITGQNIWIWQERLQPRPRLKQLGDRNPLGAPGVGAFLYDAVDGNEYPVVSSARTFAVLRGNTWTNLTD